MKFVVYREIIFNNMLLLNENINFFGDNDIR